MDEVAVILFDGHCGFCSSSVRRIHRADRAFFFRFAAQQSEMGQRLLAGAGFPPEPGTMVVLLPGGRSLTKSDAALCIASRLAFPYRAATVLRLVPRRLRDAGYDFIARHRHRLWGRTEACMVPDEALRRRFEVG